jgi:hypothetical protein
MRLWQLVRSAEACSDQLTRAKVWQKAGGPAADSLVLRESLISCSLIACGRCFCEFGQEAFIVIEESDQ